MSTKKKSDLVARLAALVAGLQQHMSGQTVTLNNGSMSVAAIIALFDSYGTQVTATAKARAAWSQQVEAEQTLDTTRVTPLVDALEDFLRAFYGASSTLLADYGIKPRRPRKVPVATKAKAVAEDLATRAARHTEGPREKEDVHGTVPATAAPTTTKS
jgi:hypothetical protein